MESIYSDDEIELIRFECSLGLHLYHLGETKELTRDNKGGQRRVY